MASDINPVIITCFAGRRPYMEVQLAYMVEILDRYDFVEHYDIWNFAWSPDDKAWIDTLGSLHEKIRVRHAPDYGQAERAGDVASKQFAYFFTEGYDPATHRDHVIVKIDDDVVYVDVDGFEDLIRARLLNPDYFLVSADVLNCNLDLPDPGALHDAFLDRIESGAAPDPFALEIFPNDRRLSINFVCWLGSDLGLIRQEFSDGIGSDDEWRLCHVIPVREKRQNLILQNCMVGHLTFGAQLQHGTYDPGPRLKRYGEFAGRGFPRRGARPAHSDTSLKVPFGTRLRFDLRRTLDRLAGKGRT